MSCFAGLLNLDGAPIDPAVLESMASQLVYRSPDGMGSWIEGAVGLVHGRFWTTPEEIGEEQPISDARGRVWLAADARVDNRSELRNRAGQVPGVPGGGEISDGRLILAAYEELGEGCCERILGDFAFALWDADRRRLLLTRDCMAMRQLFYAVSSRTLVFGTTLGSVLAALPEKPALNRNLIEAFLQGSYRPWYEHTVHQGVLRLPPGSSLTASIEGIRAHNWWRLGDTFAQSPSSDEEWIEAFGELFDEAVNCRLRSSTPVGVLAGGGVDSATIACSAYGTSLRRAGPELQLFSLTFAETPSADEREYLDELAGWLRHVTVHRIEADHLPLSLGAAEDDDHPLDEPELNLMRSQTQALFGAAAASGCRVVLSGDAANPVLGHHFYSDPRGLRLLGCRDLLAELPNFRRATGAGTLDLLARGFLWPLVPAALGEGVKRLIGGGKKWVRAAGPGSWRRRLPPLPRREVAAGVPASGRWAAWSVSRPFDLARHSAIDVTAAHSGVEWRQPFLDRRLVDLMMHAPLHLRSWRGEDRRILRLSRRGKMPERIRKRRTKIHTNDVLERLLREQRPVVDKLVESSLGVELHYASRAVAGAFTERWSGAGDCFGTLPFLCLETWLRHRAGRSA